MASKGGALFVDESNDAETPHRKTSVLLRGSTFVDNAAVAQVSLPASVPNSAPPIQTWRYGSGGAVYAQGTRVIILVDGSAFGGGQAAATDPHLAAADHGHDFFIEDWTTHADTYVHEGFLPSACRRYGSNHPNDERRCDGNELYFNNQKDWLLRDTTIRQAVSPPSASTGPSELETRMVPTIDFYCAGCIQPTCAAWPCAPGIGCTFSNGSQTCKQVRHIYYIPYSIYHIPYTI
eukprot:SAG31_NODE_281_length_18584_cov_10.762564_16_plen_235_part_00